MNTTGYLVSIVLVLLVLRQVRETRLGMTSLILPVAAVAATAVYYLAIARFSAAHSITSASAWVAAIVIMALAEVVARTATLRLRARAVPAAMALKPTPA